MSRYYQNLYFGWAAIFLVGAIADIWSYIAIYVAVFAWLVSFVIHFINQKSFEKYKL